jgi:bleomycin hydrolase
LVTEKSDKIVETKAKMIQEIHLILTLTLGPPPDPRTEFSWEYYDKDDKFHVVKTTPIDFAKLLESTDLEQPSAGTDPRQMFSLVNDPRNEYMTHLSVSRLGNIVEGRNVTYVNVDMDTIKKTTIAMLKAGIPVFFGSDVGKFSERLSGIMDPALIDYELGFNVRLGLTKAQRLETGESQMTHAMVLTAVHLVDDKPVRWRVENSWGTESGVQGWFVASDEWMDQFTYQVVVDPR